MVKNPPSNAEDAGSIPDQGTKIPHATGKLSQHLQLLSTRTLEPTSHNEEPGRQKKRKRYKTIHMIKFC